jgi:hypothetical protein
VDALSSFGVRHIDMPLTPERVWRAIRDAQGQASSAPAPTATQMEQRLGTTGDGSDQMTGQPGQERGEEV